MPDHTYFSNVIWQIADLLRGPYRPPQYERVMLPMTVLRRFDAVLESTKPAVLAEYEKRRGKLNDEALDGFLNRTAKQRFHNRSPLDFEKLKGDPDNLNKLTMIGTWEVQQLAYLLGRMTGGLPRSFALPTMAAAVGVTPAQATAYGALHDAFVAADGLVVLLTAAVVAGLPLGSTAPRVYIYNFYPTSRVDDDIELKKKAGTRKSVSGLGYHHTEADRVSATNVAVAYASCDGCRAVSLSFQVVLADRGPEKVDVRNVAVAMGNSGDPAHRPALENRCSRGSGASGSRSASSP